MGKEVHFAKIKEDQMTDKMYKESERVKELRITDNGTILFIVGEDKLEDALGIDVSKLFDF